MASHARSKRPSLASLVAASLVILDRCGLALCYFADWSAISQERFDDEPTCVPIPRNLSLCHGIGYTKVRQVSVNVRNSIGDCSIYTIQGSAKRWTLSCVNPAFWLLLAARGEFTQPRVHLVANPCMYVYY